jgi:hypothetical protein
LGLNHSLKFWASGFNQAQAESLFFATVTAPYLHSLPVFGFQSTSSITLSVCK